MKTLFITPHLSTGGLPQYLVQQVEKKLADGEEVWVEQETYDGIMQSGLNNAR